MFSILMDCLRFCGSVIWTGIVAQTSSRIFGRIMLDTTLSYFSLRLHERTW